MKFKKLSEGAAKYARSQGINVFSLGTKQKRWVRALRSGDYTKAIGHLCAISTSGKKYHCCLGVACDVSGTCETGIDSAVEFGQYPRINKSGTIKAVSLETFDTEEVCLPNAIEGEYGFFSDVASISDDWFNTFYDFDLQDKKSKYISEIKGYINRFQKTVPYDDLTEFNDGIGHNIPAVSHNKIADFVEAYPQAIFNQAI